MQKLRFFFFLMLLPSILYAQQRTIIKLIRSEFMDVDNKSKVTYLKKPFFEHDGAILNCDSARLWSELNYFEAFGNVHINQGDTINIYSDLLNYDGNAKMAHLMNNVLMSDPSSKLTTNIFDYNMATRVGTYIDNGKIVNKQATITSKKGFYLARTKDAYFRYNVVVVTDQATIKSDTLRYNTFTDQTYFYGPTNIKGKDDNLYTENGEYNTKTEKAFFGKKNLYTQDTKTLKGDSLYYDGKKGYGKAVKNIFFTDSKDKLLLRGQLGEYYKEVERIVVTRNAYVGIGTADSITINNKRVPDSLWLGADTLEAQMALQGTLKLIAKPIVLQDNEIGVEEEKSKATALKANQPSEKPTLNAGSPTPKSIPKENTKQDKKGKNDKEKEEKNKIISPSKLIDSARIKTDSLKQLTDSSKLALSITASQDSLNKDSIAKSQKTLAKDSLKIATSKTNVKTDSIKDTTKKNPTTPPKLAQPINKSASVKDSLPLHPADTLKTRTIKAYHNVRIYKSNLQAKSDSLFFTAADSTLRLYQNPILWSDSSQQSGDTIHVQFKNSKINSAQVFQNAFIADQESDTTKFNQIKGRTITAFFNDGEIRNMYIDGNAESIYYDKQKDGTYQQNQSISARIKITFQDKDISIVKTVKGIEGTFLPANKTAKDAILTGFIWKPELRPKSKDDVIRGLSKSNSASPKVNTVKPKIAPKTTQKKPAAKSIVPAKKQN